MLFIRLLGLIMRFIISILLIASSLNSLIAQFSEQNSLYLSNEINVGNYFGFDINLNYLRNDKYSLKIGHTRSFRDPISKPSDYTSGFSGLISFGVNRPYDQIHNYSILFGKIHHIKGRENIRFNISVGIGYSQIVEPENWIPIDVGLFQENYTWNYSQFDAISIIVNPKIEFPFTKVFGLSVSPLVYFNTERVFYGIGIGYIIGLTKSTNPNNN